jgi:light-regulated signal transduction histidine kinase (bacteriophytochrome)
VLGDGVQLVQLFQNLLGNGIKFHGPAKPALHIGVKREGREWRLSFKDNGIGIDPADFDRIFIIFQRLHTREEYPGTGIGLAICKKIVERHGGRIWVEAGKDQGSTFHFTLPVQEGPTP